MLQDRSPPKPQNVPNFPGSPSRFNRKYVARRPPVRKCTLVKTVPDPDMPTQIDTNTEVKYKKEVELVSEKVNKTKHEIEELKAQLEQLIKEGISKNNFTETKQNLSQHKVDKINEIKAKTFKDNVAETFRDDVIEKKLTGSILKPTGIKQTNKEEPGKKVRHYDQEVAREYIKKQREKRKEEVSKNKKDVVSSADLRKQRLQQLRQKSLKLLSKNIDLNRARSRSREPAEKDQTPGIQYNSPASVDYKNVSFEKPPIPHPHLQNITVRSRSSDLENETPNLINANDLLRQKSALKIQAAFKGYRQRKIYEELKTRKKQSSKEHSVARTPTVMPYPYNFINAVKRKLNLVTRQDPQVRMVDAAIQSSLVGDLKSPNVDLKSFLSHKCLELEPLTLFNKKSSCEVNVENSHASESDTSKNIPELSSESSISECLQKKSVHSTKRSHSSDDDKKLAISFENVKKLKLRQIKSIDSEISEHLSEATERISARDSIIASNKCNYVTSTNSPKSVSVVSTIAEVSNEKTYMKGNDVEVAVTYSFDNKENISQVTTAQDRSNKTSNGYSSNFTNVSTDIPKLEPPRVSLKTTLPISSAEGSDAESTRKLIANVQLRHGEKSTLESKAKANEIHLKFEAELHLLNDFNDSLRRVMAVEKSLLELHDKKNEAALNFESRDTQTSINQQNQVASINYSRGCDVTESLSFDKDFSIVTTGLELSPFNSPIEESNSEASVVKEKLKTPNVLSGISLEMFEQLIKDEDARIEHLKAILKIREKSLVDRTKGELAWLEVQKKHLRDAGQLQQISAIKKKQRGLLIKLEHERHEMQRLKQMQKAASKERKCVLREQRNMIKAQLAAGNTVTRIKRNIREEKRHSGPFKVYNIKSHNDSILSETSVTRKSSITTEEVVSATSNHSHSIVSHISEELILSEKIQIQNYKDAGVSTENVKRSLLMREAALQKRKKVAEELLQWHQRLLEEERKITELELAASAIINQVPITKALDESMTTKQKFKGSQLNQLWLSLTGRTEKKFKDEEIYNMSQTSLEKFCKNAKKYEKVAAAHKKNRGVDVRKSIKTKSTIPIEDVTRSNSEITEYLSDFESVVTSATSSVSEHCQTNGDSTLSDHEVETVTEITKPKNNKNNEIDRKFQDTAIEENTFDINESIFTNEDDLKSVSQVIHTETDDKNDEESNISTESKEDTSHISRNVVNQILSEIDKYLEFQTNKSESIRSSYQDGTAASKSISTDDNDNSAITNKDAAQIFTSICDKTQVIDEVSDIDEPSSTVAGSEIKSTIASKKTETVRTEENNDNTAEVPEEDVTVSISVEGDGFCEVPAEVSEEFTNSNVIATLSNRDSDNSFKVTSKITETINETSELNQDENSDGINSKVSETKTNIHAELITGTVHDETASSICEVSEPGQLISDGKISEKCDNDQETDHTPEEYSEGISCVDEQDNNEGVRIGEGFSKPKDDTKFISLLEESNKSSAEDTTISTVSELNRSISKIDDVQTKADSAQEEVSLKEINKTSSSKVSEDLKKSTQTQSNAFNELPYRGIAQRSASDKKLDVTVSTFASNDDESRKPLSSIIKSKSELMSNSASPGKTIATSSSVTEIEEDEVSIKMATEEENEDIKSITDLPIVNDHTMTEKKSTLSKPYDEKSSSETIDSITEIEEDEVSEQKLISYNDLEENSNKNSFVDLSIHDVHQNRQESKSSTETNKESQINSINSFEKVAEIEEGTNNGCDTEKEDSLFEESTTAKTEPRLLLSYGYIDKHEEERANDEETSTNKSLSNHLDSEKNRKDKTTDIKKRVSEILADANISSPRGDRSPRMQDFYVTAYDVASPNSSETTSPTDDAQQSSTPQGAFASDEVEELLKKQLEIEQEIKAIQQLQQKEQLPYLYVREIPNKPPPPYTPPVKSHSSIKGSVLPSGDSEIATITKASAQILHKAAVSNNIKDVALTDNAKKFLELKNNVEGQCYEFLFDLSKEFALDHYKQFEPETGPSWTHLHKRTKLAIGKPFDQTGLQKFINRKVKQVLGHEIVKSNENFKHKWSGKKRDHVDDLLVVECQGEEAEWTNYDRDELIVKDELSKEIMNMLLSETGQVLNNILSKKKYLC